VRYTADVRRFILIRHSTPIVRPELPAVTWHLSGVGLHRSEELADVLADEFNVAAVWSSREPKAVETAEVIARKAGKPLDTDVRFGEQHRTNVPYLGSNEFRAAVAEALSNPNDLVYGTETIAAAARRFRAGLESLNQEAPDGDVAIVSHGTVIAGFLASEIDVDPVEVWRSLGLPGFVVIEWPEPTEISEQRNFDA
jgi:broad specificity phosphatase PhoE